jgi:hypothetical protein
LNRVRDLQVGGYALDHLIWPSRTAQLPKRIQQWAEVSDKLRALLGPSRHSVLQPAGLIRI